MLRTARQHRADREPHRATSGLAASRLALGGLFVSVQRNRNLAALESWYNLGMKSSEFMRALPDAVRPKLAKRLRDFEIAGRPWLMQFYYDDPRIHYEVSNLGERRGRLEIGLHFESQDRQVNARWLEGVLAHLFEIKAQLGPSFEAEPWDKGWTKVYETIPLERFSADYLERVAARAARVIEVLEPIRRDISKSRAR